MKNKWFLILIVFSLLFIFKKNVFAGSEFCDSDEDITYYNFYLFTEGLTNDPVGSSSTTKYADPYDYFDNSEWLYDIQDYGTISIGGSNNSGTTIYAGSASATLSNWTVQTWYNNFKTIYNSTSGYTRNSVEHASYSYSSSGNMIRYIVAGNSGGSFDSSTAVYTKSFSSVDYAGYSDASSFVSSSPTTYIAFCKSKSECERNPAYQIYNQSPYNGEFYGTSADKKFKIYRNYGSSSYNPFNNGYTGVPVYYANKGKTLQTVFTPAAYYIKYKCRKPCDPTRECCYDSSGVEHDDYEGSSVYHFKYINPRTGAQGKKGSTYSQLKTCGCDPTEACCYDSSGNLHREYNPNNKPGRTYQQSYRFVRDYGTDDEDYPEIDYNYSNGASYGSAYKKVSCGCEPMKKCCFDSSGNYQYNSGSFVQVNQNDENSRQVVSCSCNGQKNDAQCGETETYDEVKGNSGSGNNVTNDFTCTMKGQYTNSGFSILTGNYNTEWTAIAPGYDVVCKDSYEVQYPDDQYESANNLGRYFTFNSRNIGINIAKVTVSRKCVSSRLTNYTMRNGAINSITSSSSKLESSNMSASLTYDDIRDIYEQRSKTRPSITLKTDGSSVTTNYYYTTSDSIPSNFTLSNSFTNSTKNSIKSYNTYYVSSVSTVSYNAVLPTIYLRGSQGDTILCENPNVYPQFCYPNQAQLPGNSLPIILTTKGNLRRNYTITLSLRNMLSRPTSYTSKRRGNLVKDPPINSDLSKTCHYTTASKTRVGGKADKFIYRTVSLSNINPTNRTLGENWNPNNRNIGTYSSLSVTEKKTKIDSYRASILLNDAASNDYSLKRTDDNYERLSEGHDHFTFEITPDTMRMIRNYNKSRVTVGGYNDWDLSILDYDDTNNADTLFRNRYVKQTTYYCGWHWYSPFLSRLTGFGPYTENVSNCGKSVSAPSWRELNSALGNSFQKEEGTMTNAELNANRRALIRKQNALDNQAFRNAGGS